MAQKKAPKRVKKPVKRPTAKRPVRRATTTNQGRPPGSKSRDKIPFRPNRSSTQKLMEVFRDLTDQEKNTRLLSVFCGILEQRASDSLIDETTIDLLKALAHYFDISIKFKEGETSGDLRERLQELLGGEI